MLLRFKIDDQGFRCLDSAIAATAISINYIKCHFDVAGTEWEDVDAICAIFKSATYNQHYEVMLDSNNNCFIDPEIYRRGGAIQVKLVGDKYINDSVISSTSTTSVVEFYIRDDIILPTPVPSKYDAFVAEIEIARQAVEDAILDLTRRIANGELKGKDGASISNIISNSNGTLTIELSDGQSYTSARPIRGEKGEPGEDGVGIASVVYGEDGTLLITMSDGTQYVSPYSMKGEKGEKGDKGDDGDTGLPTVTTADAGKFLRVSSSGTWAVEAAGGELVWFDDRNDSVMAYLNGSVGYTDANRSNTSVIRSYASTSIQDQDCPKPFLNTYNLDPNADNTIDNWTVKRLGYAPRMMKLDGVWNVRDCGGWNADNGKVKFGYLFRGSRLSGASSSDLTILANAGIKFELDIRDAGNAAGTVATIPGSTYRNVSINNAYAQMINSEATAAATACIAAMESIVDDKPVYIHCASGADRTGCICAMLEALLGVSDTDIDRDFEMTDFADIEDLTGHVRNGGSWTGFWSALNSGQSNAKMNVARFLRNNGATTSLLNSFREKMIDGNPSSIDIPTYTITNNLSGCSTNNSATSVDGGVPYSATITPNSGYTIKTFIVTMGGVDITSTAVSGNMITIANVTGAIVITAVAEGNFTNLVHQSQEVSSTAIYNGGLGYKNGYYLDSGDGHESSNASDCMTGCIPYDIGNTQPTDILYIKGYTAGASESHTRLCVRKADKTRVTSFNGFLNANNIFDVETLGTGYYKLTPKEGVYHNFTISYVQFSFHQPDASGIIITKNEPIE
jgi:hypothetical protein